MNFEAPHESRRALRWPWGVTLAVFAVLVALPATRGIVWQETRAVFGPPDQLSSLLASMGLRTDLAERAPKLSSRRLDQIAEVSPAYRIQFACALYPPYAGERLTRLRAMKARFPNDPSLYAALLQNEANSDVRFDRPEEDLLTESTLEKSPFSPEPPSTTANLAAFDADAAHGEAIEPENAFFPFMRSVGLIAQHRDADAIDAVERAASKPEWNEHFAEQLNSEIELHREFLGDDSAVERSVLEMSLLFPHLARLRAVTRVLTYEAVTAERSGDPRRGIAIRLALMRCGSVMRAKSSSAIGTLVGIAITGVAESRPGGGPVVKKPENMSDAAWTTYKRATFLAYLRREGYVAEADWAMKEFAAGDQARIIISRAVNIGVPIRPLVQWAEVQLLGMVLLADFCWFAAIAAIAALFTRTRRQGPGAAVLLAVFFIALFVVSMNMSQWAEAYKEVWLVFMQLSGVNYMGGMPLLFANFGVPIATLLIPGLWAVVVLVGGWARKRGAVGAIAHAAPIAGMVMLLLYGLAMAPAVAITNRIDFGVEQTVEHEGPYDAAQVGLAWPGLVPFTSRR